VLDALVGWQREVIGGSSSVLRAIDRGAMHVTLCFLGMRPAEEVEELALACDALSGRAVGGLALGSAVWLPRRRPGVLACAVEDDRGELRDAHAVLAGRLRAAGALEPEERIFFPHATVARVRGGSRVRPSPLAGPAAIEFNGASVTLYRSVLGSGPAGYESLHRVALGTR
jgi:2'-5' RNA ligase